MSEQAGGAEVPRDGEAAGGVDLPADLRAEIREFARALPELDYYQILGVERDADAEQIRDAFFSRSKRYHPDRYFRRNLGSYEGLLHEIYKRVVVANDVLRDPKLRGPYDKTLAPPAGAAKAPRSASERPTRETRQPSSGAASSPPPRKATGGSSLRDRKGLGARRSALGGLERQLESGRLKARQHFEEAKLQKEAGDWVRSASLIRLAIAYDPRNGGYHDALAEVLPQANQEQANAARRRGEILLLKGERSAAIEFLAEAARLLPTDATLSLRVAELITEVGGSSDEAIGLARRAVELEEGNPAYHKRLGMIYRKADRSKEARRELQRAWELDPTDKEVKAALRNA